MPMKVSDYIVKFLIANGIRDVFGYPGGMVTHLMDSFERYKDKITAHTNYHEQACAMAACGWAEITGLPGVAYATSGPGATNLLTGISCAYFESLPCIFITGQVNTYEQKGALGVRQKGFQELDIVSMARPVTKDAYMVTRAAQIPENLERAYVTAMSGRRGPVLLDIPMDVSRGEIICENAIEKISISSPEYDYEAAAIEILTGLQNAKCPVILAGHGISLAGMRDVFREFVSLTGIPTVTSMIAVDVLPTNSAVCYGMIGAYGLRWANFIINHSDCLLALGSRMDCRQTGVNKTMFAPNAKIFRIDADPGEIENQIHADDHPYVLPLEKLLPVLLERAKKLSWDTDFWRRRCDMVRAKLCSFEEPEPGNILVKQIGATLPDDITITTDVGQNQVWVAQSLTVKDNQRVLFSGGHGAMGYSLPAAIGAAIATKRPVVCFVGDGGLQMNIQELEFVYREQLPIKIVLFNNHVLGMIHHFQDMYFDGSHAQTDSSHGYTVPQFYNIARAYGIRTLQPDKIEMFSDILKDNQPAFIELALPEATHVFPKLGLNKPIHEQEPPLPEKTVDEVISILKQTV